MFQDKIESLADHLWDIHGLQLVRKNQISTALNIDAANASFHLESLLVGNFYNTVNRAKIDHAVGLGNSCGAGLPRYFPAILLLFPSQLALRGQREYGIEI